MAFSDILTPLLGPLLSSVGPFWMIVIVSLFISGLTTWVYYLATDQKKLRKLKADLKRYQKKAAKLQKTDPEKALQVQKDMMKLNGQYMKSSFRSTLFTFLPVILVFGWLTAHLSFAPLVPGETFVVQAQFTPGTEGTYSLLSDVLSDMEVDELFQDIESGSVAWNVTSPVIGQTFLTVRHDPSGEEYQFPVLASFDQEKVTPSFTVEGAVLKQVSVQYQKLYVFDGVFFFQHVPWMKNWGWLGAYIVFSLIFSTILRRTFKIA